MILYQPQLLLVPSVNGHLFLHSTTFFDTINFKPKGYKVKKKLTKAGVLKVELYVVSDNSFSEKVMNMKCINPVVHHVDLGDLLSIDDDNELNGSIEAIVYFKSNARTGGRRRTGSSTIKKVSSGGDTRPNPNNPK